MDIKLIGLKPKIIAQILGISLSGVYAKIKERNGNKFTENDLDKIKKFLKNQL